MNIFDIPEGWFVAGLFEGDPLLHERDPITGSTGWFCILIKTDSSGWDGDPDDDRWRAHGHGRSMATAICEAGDEAARITVSRYLASS